MYTIVCIYCNLIFEILITLVRAMSLQSHAVNTFIKRQMSPVSSDARAWPKDTFRSVWLKIPLDI